MATPVWAPGYVCKASIKPTGAGGFTDINITGWDWGDKVPGLLVTHTGSSGVAGRIPSVLDGTGMISFNYDLANQQNLSPYSIVPGATGLIRVFVSAAKFFEIPYYIEEVPYKVVVEGKVEVQARFMMNSEAGTYIRPV